MTLFSLYSLALSVLLSSSLSHSRNTRDQALLTCMFVHERERDLNDSEWAGPEDEYVAESQVCTCHDVSREHCVPYYMVSIQHRSSEGMLHFFRWKVLTRSGLHLPTLLHSDYFADLSISSLSVSQRGPFTTLKKVSK